MSSDPPGVAVSFPPCEVTCPGCGRTSTAPAVTVTDVEPVAWWFDESVMWNGTRSIRGWTVSCSHGPKPMDIVVDKDGVRFARGMTTLDLRLTGSHQKLTDFVDRLEGGS